MPLWVWGLEHRVPMLQKYEFVYDENSTGVLEIIWSHLLYWASVDFTHPTAFLLEVEAPFLMGSPLHTA
jgi:hypothetical protein